MSSEGLKKVELLIVELKTLESTASNPWLKDQIIDMCAGVEVELKEYHSEIELGADELEAFHYWIEEYAK